VITSNTSSLPEVAGDAALLVDPHDIHAIAQAITEVMENETLQEDLRQKGYAQVQRYTWSQAASKMLSVYQQLYEGVTTFSDDLKTPVHMKE
jgi:glycosyltransferase involved in cell wall biosynthesis